VHIVAIMTPDMPDILALIPARSGSKSFRDKNIHTFRGKPLLAHSIDHARASARITRIVVSTDSEWYAAIAREHGAETPFLRPPELSGDRATDLEAFRHALAWLRDNEHYEPELCVHLRPTCPIRNPVDIDAAVDMLLAHPDADSVRSISPAPVTPYKMWRLLDDGYLQPLLASDMREPYNMPRQDLPAVYCHNGCIDVVRASVIMERNLMSGTRILAYRMSDFVDVDELRDLEDAGASALPALRGKTWAFDIDGVIASIVSDMNYADAQPLGETIGIINRLYDAGNTIYLYTARGTMTGIDWRDVTEGQMRTWGVKYHRLFFGKPGADYYIDDRFTTLHAITTAIRTEERHT
jgi:CMP-N-acetylneuraminic acid synthetase